MSERELERCLAAAQNATAIGEFFNSPDLPALYRAERAAYLALLAHRKRVGV